VSLLPLVFSSYRNDLLTLLSLFSISCRDVFIEKHYRGTISRAVCDEFWKFVSKAGSATEVLPIIPTPKCYLVHVQRGGLFFLAIVQGETPPLLVLEFLGSVADVFREYFTKLSEEKLREHYLVVCQVCVPPAPHGLRY
jgi:hypothetical protein